MPPEKIISHGRSVGTGPATYLAARAPIGGLVLESGFTSTFVVLTRVRLFPFDRFDNLRNLRRTEVPVLVIHGIEDEVIPFAHGCRLHAAARGPKAHFWVEGAGHNDLAMVAGAEYGRALRRFAESLASVGR